VHHATHNFSAQSPILFVASTHNLFIQAEIVFNTNYITAFPPCNRTITTQFFLAKPLQDKLGLNLNCRSLIKRL